MGINSSQLYRIVSAGLLLLAAICLSRNAHAQTASPSAPASEPLAVAAAQAPQDPKSTLLPEAPNPVPASSSLANSQTAPIPEASHTQKVIEPGQPAPALTPGEKMRLSLRNSFSLYAAAGWVTAAGYEQLVNSSPNYGTDRGAFGERVGAAVIRDTTEGILSDGVMASALHEDPRYYRLGPDRNPALRIIYAITRPLITRTDSGNYSPNLSLMTGTLGGAALTNAYYPSIDHGGRQTLKVFGGSMGGEALSDMIREFFGDFTDTVRDRK